MSKNECRAIPTDRPSSIQYASLNARVRTYIDHATSASPAATPRIASAALSLGRLESSCAVAGDPAVATDKEEESSDGDWDEEDKAK